MHCIWFSSVFFNLEWFPNLCFTFVTLILFKTGCHACSVMSDSQRPHGLLCCQEQHRDLCPWDFPGKNTGVGCHFLLQGIFLTQGSNPPLRLLHWQADSLPLSHWGSPLFKIMDHFFLQNVPPSEFVRSFVMIRCRLASSVEWLGKWCCVLTASRQVAHDFNLSLVILS